MAVPQREVMDEGGEKIVARNKEPLLQTQQKLNVGGEGFKDLWFDAGSNCKKLQ